MCDWLCLMTKYICTTIANKIKKEPIGGILWKRHDFHWHENVILIVMSFFLAHTFAQKQTRQTCKDCGKGLEGVSETSILHSLCICFRVNDSTHAQILVISQVEVGFVWNLPAEKLGRLRLLLSTATKALWWQLGGACVRSSPPDLSNVLQPRTEDSKKNFSAAHTSVVVTNQKSALAKELQQRSFRHRRGYGKQDRPVWRRTRVKDLHPPGHSQHWQVKVSTQPVFNVNFAHDDEQTLALSFTVCETNSTLKQAEALKAVQGTM